MGSGMDGSAREFAETHPGRRRPSNWVKDFDAEGFRGIVKHLYSPKRAIAHGDEVRSLLSSRGIVQMPKQYLSKFCARERTLRKLLRLRNAPRWNRTNNPVIKSLRVNRYSPYKQV